MMEEKLPKGWEKSTISKIGKVVTGNTPSKGNQEYFNGDIPWVKPGDVKKGRLIFKTEETLTKLGAEKARMLPKGSVIVTCIGDLGNVAVAGKELATNQQINSIVVDESLVDHKFVYYWSLTLKRWLIENSTSTTISMVNKSRFENAPIIIPPLPEQQRIVAKLDALFGHLDSLREKLDGIPALLKNFRQQVLTQAVTGELTKEWREGKGLGEWENKKLEEICISITDGDHQAPPKAESGIPFLVISDISNGVLNLKKASRFVPIQYFENLKESRKPKKNDILYTVTGSIGIPVLLENDYEFTFQRHIGIIRPNVEQINERFLHYTLMSEYCLTQGRNVATGTAQLTIPLRGLRNYEIPLPLKEEQQEIVNRVNIIFTLADKIESQYTSLKAKIDQLPQAILAKAFQGELVGQEVKEYVVEEREGLMAAEEQLSYQAKTKT